MGFGKVRAPMPFFGGDVERYGRPCPFVEEMGMFGLPRPFLDGLGRFGRPCPVVGACDEVPVFMPLRGWPVARFGRSPPLAGGGCG